MTNHEQLIELLRLGYQTTTTMNSKQCLAPGNYCKECNFSSHYLVCCTTTDDFQQALTNLRAYHPECFI